MALGARGFVLLPQAKLKLTSLQSLKALTATSSISNVSRQHYTTSSILQVVLRVYAPRLPGLALPTLMVRRGCQTVEAPFSNLTFPNLQVDSQQILQLPSRCHGTVMGNTVLSQVVGRGSVPRSYSPSVHKYLGALKILRPPCPNKEAVCFHCFNDCFNASSRSE